MFKGYNTLKVCQATMKEIVQAWLDDSLGDDAPTVTNVTMKGGGYWKSVSYEIEIRGETDPIVLSEVRTEKAK
jgi:hypothetical protein